MAYIYRYHFRNINLRNNIILTEYLDDIKLVLNEHFTNNLKDSFIDNQYFEFKLYTSVSNGLLQEMGRKLKRQIPNFSNGYGFVRMEQTLYMLAYSDEDQSDNVHVEFIDSLILDSPKEYIERAKSFFENKMITLSSENIYNYNNNEIIKNYYVDVIDSYIDKTDFKKLFNDNGSNFKCYFVKGYHKRYSLEESSRKEYKNNSFLLEKCFDVEHLDKFELSNKKEKYGLDFIEINKIKLVNKEEEIKMQLKLSLPIRERISQLDKIMDNIGEDKNSKYRFRVHNVGQALATSLSLDDNSSFVYFDYGMPFGSNNYTIPAQINMPIKEDDTIIISHLDKDHWFRVKDDISAYKCNWFIPDQLRKVQFNKVVAEIVVTGGTVQTIKKNIKFSHGKLTCGGVSNKKPSRLANNVHETGLSLRIEGKDINGDDVNILVAGDQMYDYIDSNQLNSLDILVASHHGGKYGWSVSNKVPIARTENAKIIYSYGKDNSHSHPSKVRDYSAANWKKEHHTSINGDFEILISL